MAPTKLPAKPPIATAPDRIERALRGSDERGRLEREFEVLGELGHGGMGTVFWARDLRLCRSVAVKVLSPSLRLDRTSTRRFAIEAQIAAQLEHPNILPFYALSYDDSGQPGIVMRLVEGESFREYLDACALSLESSLAEPRDLASRVERFLKACDAVEYAHARGVVHRDLKPENIMLGAHNEVYVVDWGLATLVDPDEAVSEEIVSLTADGQAIGTPLYMAPEQARGDRGSVGTVSDQFALGLMLQEIVTLESPRKLRGAQGLVRAASRNERAPFQHRFGRRLPRSLEAIVAKATATRPEDRYPSVAAFARDLRRFVRGDEVQALPDPAWARLWRRLRRRPGLVLGTLLSLALLASATTTIALARELGARARADREARHLASLTAKVARIGGAVDGRIALVEVILEGLAASGSATLERPPELPRSERTPDDLDKDPASTTFSPRYHQRVTFDHAVDVVAPSAHPADSLMAHSGDFERLLTRAAVRAAGDDEALGRAIAEQRVIAREGGAPVVWTSNGFEEGVMFVYPGNTFFPADFDARKRVWYQLVAHGRAHKCGSPYPDATSGALLVPCCVPMFDAADRFIGVAAMHLALDELLSRIALDGIEEFRESAVLDERGNVVFSTRERGRLLAAGVHDNRALDRHPFPVVEVRDALAHGSRDGSVRVADAIVVYQRLGSFDWWLAVTFASSEAAEPKTPSGTAP